MQYSCDIILWTCGHKDQNLHLQRTIELEMSLNRLVLQFIPKIKEVCEEIGKH